MNRRTDTDGSALIKWSHESKEAWLEKNLKLVDFVSDSGARYVESVFLMFSRTLLANNKLLNLYVFDACAGKVILDCYTLYLIVGFSSNGNIIPVAHMPGFRQMKAPRPGLVFLTL